jgi:hypothetical protein
MVGVRSNPFLAKRGKCAEIVRDLKADLSFRLATQKPAPFERSSAPDLMDGQWECAKLDPSP